MQNDGAGNIIVPSIKINGTLVGPPSSGGGDFFITTPSTSTNNTPNNIGITQGSVFIKKGGLSIENGSINVATAGNSVTAETFNCTKINMTGSTSVFLSNTGASFHSTAVEFSGGTVKFSDGCLVSGLTTSDYRLKSNVRDIDELTTLNLRPVQFDMHDKHRIGLIAHEVQEIIPCVVNGVKDGKEYQSVEYIDLISVLIKDIQRLNKKIIDNDAKSESRLSQLENSTTR